MGSGMGSIAGLDIAVEGKKNLQPLPE